MQIRIGTKSNISINAKRAADGLIAAISVAYTITRGSTSCHRKIEPTNTIMRRIGRALLNARPIGAAGVLWSAGDDLVNHDSVERAVNHQGVRDGQHHIAMPNDQCLDLGEAVTAEAIACHQHPQHIITALASVVETGKPLLGPSQWLRGICAGAEPGDQKGGRGLVPA